MCTVQIRTGRGLKTPVAAWHCHPEDLGPSGRFMATVFWKPDWKIGSKYVRTVQDVSGELKFCLDSPICVRTGWYFVQTAQNTSVQTKMCPDGLKFLSRQLKICPDSPKCVQTLQDVSGQFKICPDSSTCVRTVQNMVGRERWLRTFLVCRERDLRVFRPEDFWVPPGRYRVFRPLDLRSVRPSSSLPTRQDFLCVLVSNAGFKCIWKKRVICTPGWGIKIKADYIESHPLFRRKFLQWLDYAISQLPLAKVNTNFHIIGK